MQIKLLFQSLQVQLCNQIVKCEKVSTVSVKKNTKCNAKY